MLKKIICIIMCTILFCSLSFPSIAAEEINNVSAYAENENLRLNMSGAGSVSSGNLTIYYPSGQVGFIHVISGGASVMVIEANGSGIHSGSHGLSAKVYDLSYIYMDGSTPNTLATGKLVITP